MLLTHLAATAYVAKSSMTVASFAWLQDAPSTVSHGNSLLLEAFVGMAALSLLVVAIVVAAVGYAALKAKNELMLHVNDLKGKVMPLIASSQGLVNDLTPQIKEITGKVNEITAKVNDITGHVGEIVVVAKEKVNEFSPTISKANVTLNEVLDKAKNTAEEANQTVKGVQDKTRVQIDRVNVMVTEALDATAKLGKAIEQGITAPGRELAGLVSGAKATVDSLMQKSSTGLNGLVGRMASMFRGKQGPAAPKRPAPAYRNNPASATYASAPPARGAAPIVTATGGFGATLPDAGVGSGSTGNGDPIL